MSDVIHCHFAKSGAGRMSVTIDRGDVANVDVVELDPRHDTARQVVRRAGLFAANDQVEIRADWLLDFTLATCLETRIAAAMAQGSAYV